MSATTPDELAVLAKLAEALGGGDWTSLEWRLDNLYWITDKNGELVRFCMNDEQRHFVRNIRPRNLILKARQLGFSTLLQILQVDQGLFNTNHTGVTIADTLPNAGKLFKKQETALANLPEALQDALPIKARNDKSEIEWDHGSSVYVSTSARGGTVQLLHVSELGKIARKHPEKAREIVTGAFEAVPVLGTIVVESTAEGAAGEFYDLCEPAMKRMAEGAPESDLDWRLHFFPWFKSHDYRLDPRTVIIPPDLTRYFDGIQAKLGITLDPWQRAWYSKKKETLKRDMKREYPSTPEEAFEQAVEGAIYGTEMTYLREHGRLTVVPLDPLYRVNTFWDFGASDKTAIWFHQQIGMQHRFFRYVEDSMLGLARWWKDLEDYRAEHDFRWGRFYLPHDADAVFLGEHVESKKSILQKLGMGSVRCGGGEIVVVPRIADIDTGIELTRERMVGNVWMDRAGCAPGIKCMDGYQYVWDDKKLMWSREPLHNWASHGADAFRQWAQSHTGAVPKDNRGDDDKRPRRARNWRMS